MKVLKFLDEKFEYIGMCITFVIMFIAAFIASPMSFNSQ